MSGSEVRGRIRAEHRASGRRFVVLDDDPTGSQCVHDVDVVLDLDPAACGRALTTPGSVCFALTNSRSLPAAQAYAVNLTLARDLYALAADAGRPLTVVSRSDSTLRGHLVDETAAIDAARREVLGAGHDGILLVPAYLEAGRATSGGVHRARVDGAWVPVGETEFARDATFGYRSSDLRDHVVERTGGAVTRDDVLAIGLDDIRGGGAERVAARLTTVDGGRWVVVDALTYDDLETVALAIALVQRDGKAFLPRTGPSFVRALAGLDPRPPLDAAALGVRRGPGLVVVGSHVGLTNAQLDVLRATGGLTEVEVDVPALLDRRDVVPAVAEEVREGLTRGSDVLLVTSRTVSPTPDRESSLAAARTVSAAVSDVVRAALPARPAWIVAKGGITSHDVAVRGLGLRRATVAGQLFAGVVSVFRPVEAAAEAIGVPYVVFAGNVGDAGSLADVVRRLSGRPSRGVRRQ